MAQSLSPIVSQASSRCHADHRGRLLSLFLLAFGCSALLAQVSIAGPTTVRQGSTAQFTAQVSGTSAVAVQWSVNGFAGGISSTGTISATGLYTPAMSIFAGHSVTIGVTLLSTPASSATLATKILNPLPAITSGFVTQGPTGTGFLLDIKGSGFVSGSALQIGAVNIATSYISPSELQGSVTLPSGTATVTAGVLNPNAEQKAAVLYTLPVPQVVISSGAFTYTGSPLLTTIAPANPSAVTANTFFGVSIANLAPNSLYYTPGMTPFPAFAVSTFRFVDVAYWAMIDASEGENNWTKMDNTIAISRKNGVSDFIFNFYRPPAWASTDPTAPCPGGEGPGTCAVPIMADFDAFVTQVVQRYCGTIEYYEPWNEPDNAQFWVGTDTQMLTIAQHVYQIAKDPKNCGCSNGTCSPNGGANPNQVLLPPISSFGPVPIAWLASYLATSGSSYPYADIVAFHGYVWQVYVPEQVVSGIQTFRTTIAPYGLGNLPLWNTEVSWKLDTYYTEQNQVSWLMRYHTMQAALGVSRVVWYAYDHCTWGTLWSSPLCATTESPQDLVGQLTLGGVSYGTIESWLTGAALKQCQEYQNGLWICELQRADNYDAWMIWSGTGTGITVPIPQDAGATVYRNWQNIVTPVTGQISVNQLPVLLENTDL